jgi:hypothetical protein
VRVPVPELGWFDAWWSAAGHPSRTYGIVILLRSVKREGAAGQRALAAEGELVKANHDLAHVLRQRDALLVEREQLLAANKGLSDKMGAYTRRIKARVPRQWWARIFDKGEA